MKKTERIRKHITMDSGGHLFHKGRLWPLNEPDRNNLINTAHELGHFGIDATLARLRHTYWWPTMRMEAEAVIGNCYACQHYEDASGKKLPPRPTQVIEALGPWDVLHMDFVGPISPASRSGNRYILVVVDHFSKWVEAFPTPDKSAATVAKILGDEIICRYDAPRAILSDQGSEFVNEVVTKLLQIASVKRLLTSGYKPNTNGQAEKTNHTLLQALRKMTHDEKDNWDAWLPYVCKTDRTRERKSTGKTPMFLMFGREARIPALAPPGSSQVMNIPNTEEEETKALSMRLGQLTELFNVVHPDIAAAAKRRREKAKEDLLRSKAIPSGTYVLLKDPISKGKLGMRYKGLYQVVSRTSMGNYELKNIRADRLSTPMPPERIRVIGEKLAQDIIHNRPMYELEDKDGKPHLTMLERCISQIVDHRVTPGGIQYLVMWEDREEWPDPNWILEAKLDAPTLLGQYWESRRKEELKIMEDPESPEASAPPPSAAYPNATEVTYKAARSNPNRKRTISKK
jgi:hypothetical protein